MSDKKYNLENKAVLDQLLLTHPDVTAGNVFGLACYKINGTVFATLYGDSVGIKLPAARVTELQQLPQFSPFMPFGKNRGKEHVAINRPYPEEYRNDEALFLESMAFVSQKS